MLRRVTVRPVDVPGPVADALASPGPGASTAIATSVLTFFVRSWGDTTGTPLLLLHGIMSSSASWWRVGPAVAATSARVLAPDMPGHGETGSWLGHRSPLDHARDLVALISALGLRAEELCVVGHSWGAMTAAALPVVGLAPKRLILIDPPVLPLRDLETMARDAVEHHYDSYADALNAVGAANDTWAFGDVVAKAEALTRFDEATVRDVLLANGDWDGGYADVADPSAAGVDRWLIRGDPVWGGLVPDEAAARFSAMLSDARVITIPRASHSPHRTHPEETVAAILRAMRVV
jgi:pimeloyl-ACP methyl ester carboxylesterase